LSPSERSEQVRDAVMAATYGAMSPDPAYVRIYLAIRTPVRRPYYQGLAEFDTGLGRIAPVGPGDYLVLVPEAAGNGDEPFDPVLVYRLLDDRYKADGASPKTVRLVTYRTRPGPGAIVPSVTVRYVRTFDGAEFYRDGSRGFVAATVGDADALRRFLAATDD